MLCISEIDPIQVETLLSAFDTGLNSNVKIRGIPVNIDTTSKFGNREIFVKRNQQRPTHQLSSEAKQVVNQF